uniref:ABC transporter domain-containing protein n=1 Tax=Emiliania huxleyi TaxID=2903 RepID=A0A7S3SBL1_EMIHU|mmetsp:Transcript_21672/g.64801  ORF Transcript_21672/g.64801 Transcript_21672/m.64801 type:complete len:634 (-) Transcript_21672:228-2129(-)
MNAGQANVVVPVEIEASVTTRRKSITVRWTDVTKEVPLDDNKSTRRILHGVSGVAVPGEVLALMGPSGSGKTTLLNCLHPERRGARVGGGVTCNGRPMRKREKRRIAYVLQEDHLFQQLTVYETLLFTARLRLATSEADKVAAVNSTIETLGLEKCRKTALSLCSGGEKKRVSIATEMLTDPSILLLDEPTSGLDSTTAAALMRTLKSVAAEGRTVVSSIHQPASNVFMSFDCVLLLCDGRSVFYGPPSATMPYFANLGFQCPAAYNPADFAMDLVNAPGDEGLTNKKTMVDAYAEGKCPTAYSPADAAEESSLATVEGSLTLKGGDAADGAKWATGWAYQLSVLTRRSFRICRADLLTRISLLECLCVTVIVGLLWWRTPWSEERVHARFSYVFFAMIFWPFSALFSALTSFPQERAILERERASGSYRLSAYFLSKSLAETPLRMAFPLLYLLVSYWMAGICDNFGVFLGFVAIELLVVIAGESLGYLIGVTFVNLRRAMAACTIVVILLMLVGGFFLEGAVIPLWMRWLRFLSPFSYAGAAASALVFTSAPTPCDGSDVIAACVGLDASSGAEASGAEVLEALGLSGINANIGFNVSMLVVWSCVVRFWAYLHLRFLPGNRSSGGAPRRQ